MRGVFVFPQGDLEQVERLLSRVARPSGRVPGDAEIRALVLELLSTGGVAIDDYSDHCWTATEIAEDRVVDGLRFFDYRTSFERSRGL